MKIPALALLIVLVSSTASAERDSVYTRVTSDTVVLWNTGVQENCASRFRLSLLTPDSNVIVLTETDTIGPIANCFCTYDLSAVLYGLRAGHYSAEVHRAYLVQYGYSRDTTVLVGLTEFDVSVLGGSVLPPDYRQSPCHSHEVGVGANPQRDPGTISLPASFILSDCYPNPANPAATVRYGIPQASHVVLTVHDLLGREVAVLVDDVKSPGWHAGVFDGTRLASGIYVCRMTAHAIAGRGIGDFGGMKKIMLLK